MGFMDKVKGMLGQHSDKVERGIDKGSETLDAKTGGKYSDKIQKGTAKSKDAMQRTRDERGGESRGGTGSSPGV